MYYENDTIYALSTVVGKSGVAIIRISGPDAFKIMNEFGIKNGAKNNELKLAKLICPNSRDVIDHAMYVRFKAPHSFTGEDVVEFHVHGSIAVIDWVLEELGKIEGLRPAEAGEFAKRAFMNGKMDLTEIEGLADLIDSETKLQHKQAMKQYEGVLKIKYENWRHEIIEILAFMEALIDFPEEDLEENSLRLIDQKVAKLKNHINEHINDNNAGEKIKTGISIAIIGSPNVGKSTLINRLVGRDLAIVANIPGTTRDIIETQINIGGFAFLIADTAGIRKTVDIIEEEGVKRSKKKAEFADIQIIMFDANHLDNLDEEIMEYANRDNSIILINKAEFIDFKFDGDIAGKKPILISLQQEKNINSLTKILEEKAKQLTKIETDSAFITRERYRYELRKALNFLEDFDYNLHPEIACENLRQAVNSIGRITGYIDVEDLLGVIFSSFCIGK